MTVVINIFAIIGAVSVAFSICWVVLAMRGTARDADNWEQGK